MQIVKSLAYLFDAFITVATFLYESLFVVKPFAWLDSFFDYIPDSVLNTLELALGVFFPGNPDILGTLVNATNVDLLIIYGVILIVNSAFTIFFLKVVLTILDIVI